jgi:hypothetical protein
MQIFKEEITLILFKLFHKIERDDMLQNSCYESSGTLIAKPYADTHRKEKIIEQ